MSFRVETGLSDRPVTGRDSTVFIPPKTFWADVDGKPTLVIQTISRFLRHLAEQQAAAIGERLHHAEFRLTKDPVLVREWTITVHDCPTCREAAIRGEAYLAEDPRHELMVGMLYWAG